MIKSNFDYQLPVVVIGSGGHAQVLVDCLQLLEREILFCTDIDPQLTGQDVMGVLVKGNDELIAALDPGEVQLVNGIGSINKPSLRKEIFELWTGRGFCFASLIHPSATVARSVVIDSGVQVMAGAVIQAGTRIHCNTIVNTGACVDHDCVIQAHCHIAPRVALSGAVYVDECSHIGTGACVIQGIKIGKECVIGAGATVVNDLPDHTIAVGTPAKPRPSN